MDPLNDKTISRLLIAAVLIAIALAALTFAGIIGDRTAPGSEIDYVSDGAAFSPAAFADLAGWRSDDAAETLPALLRSCARMAQLSDDAPANPSAPPAVAAFTGSPPAGVVGDWRTVCAQAARIMSQTYADDNARKSVARSFYEFYFRPVRLYERLRPLATGAAAAVKLDPKGGFTGYFEPHYEASRSRSAVFSAAVYARPGDLVTVDLGRFLPELAGQRVAGRVVDGALDPYPDHAAINAGAVSGQARVLAWMRPSDLLFLQIQGSGRLLLPDGQLRVGYDGANGRPYTAIGKTLIEMGALSKETVSMQTIRAWLDGANDDDSRFVRESNQSFVFFRVLDNLPDDALGPLGAEGVQLTPGRSIAVDPRYTPYGAPVWVSIDGDKEKRKSPVRRLMIAQDAGGAIKGPVRGDIFVGSGQRAGAIAGEYNEVGEMFILLPTALVERLTSAPQS